jgi:hypothetical protein
MEILTSAFYMKYCRVHRRLFLLDTEFHAGLKENLFAIIFRNESAMEKIKNQPPGP